MKRRPLQRHPSANRSVLDEAIAALSAPAAAGPGQARLINAPNPLLHTLDRVLERALALQGGAGSALREPAVPPAGGLDFAIERRNELLRRIGIRGACREIGDSLLGPDPRLALQL